MLMSIISSCRQAGVSVGTDYKELEKLPSTLRVQLGVDLAFCR
jgi:hypothetical protein